MDKNILWMHLAVCAGIVVLVWTNWFDVQSWEKYGMIFSGVLGALSFWKLAVCFFQE